MTNLDDITERPMLQPASKSLWRTGFPWAMGVFAALSLYWGITGKGFLEADGCAHYMMSRFSFSDPRYLSVMWGRPICTGLYALPAWLGQVEGVRVCSLMVALIVALLTVRIARKMGMVYPELAGLCVMAQPLFFMHSFSELTELPFAMLLALALFAYQSRRWWLLTIVAGLMPLSRPEGFAMLPAIALLLALHRQWKWILLLPMGLLGWDVMGWYQWGQIGPWWKWLINNWPYAANSTYAAGPIYHFLVRLPMIIGPAFMPALFVGWWCMGGKVLAGGWRQTIRSWLDIKDDAAHQQRLRTIIVLLPMGVLLGHSVLYAMGKMASNGEMRYLLVVSPMWALLCAEGVQQIGEYFSLKRIFRWAAVGAMLPLAVQLYKPVFPLPESWAWPETHRLADWYSTWPLKDAYPRTMVAHPGFNYYLDCNPLDSTRTQTWSNYDVAHPQPGVLLIWDPVFALYNSDEGNAIRVREILAAGWREIPWPAEAGPLPEPVVWSASAARNSPPPGDTWRLFVSPMPAAAIGEVLPVPATRSTSATRSANP